MDVTELPNELIMEFLTKMSITDFCKTKGVCDKFYKFGEDEKVWQRLCATWFPKIMKYKPDQRGWRWLCLQLDKAVFSQGVIGEVKEIKEINTNTGIERKPHGIAIVGDDLIEIKFNREPLSYIRVGEFVNGKLHGKGKMFINLVVDPFNFQKTKQSNLYIGDWEHGIQQGHGEFYWHDGDHYMGDWVNNYREGNGTYTWSNGSSYVGEFKENRIEGFGRHTWKNGYYEGEWKSSKRNGKGKNVWENGHCYEGEFIENLKCGQGKYSWPDGTTYEGEWKNNNREGNGVVKWINGISYVGKYSDDLRNGKGVLTWLNGDYYVGQWKNGGRQGVGKFYSNCSSSNCCVEQLNCIEQFWNEPEEIKYSKDIPEKYPPL